MLGYFSAKEVAKLAGVSRRQLAYWVEAGVIRAQIDTQGGTRRRRYSFEDLVTVRAVATFTRAGVKAAAVKATAERLRQELQIPGSIRTLSNTRLVTDGKSLFRFEPAVDALVRVDASAQLAFAFDCGTELTDLVEKLEARRRPERYNLKTEKAA
ncbi:MerR family transcriptional regulator [uncultured Hydrogenophaga sp.]|uniref:MerR family transcriptional regulator n=1 Tax=uncultured Hydrogenophaga sp. TaxID=199683 RepID=UPI002587ED41|nr:MerR family transcriptional regulator [uncultured Hydrogenophaga sp.]